MEIDYCNFQRILRGGFRKYWMLLPNKLQAKRGNQKDNGKSVTFEVFAMV